MTRLVVFTPRIVLFIHSAGIITKFCVVAVDRGEDARDNEGHDVSIVARRSHPQRPQTTTSPPGSASGTSPAGPYTGGSTYEQHRCTGSTRLLSSFTAL